MSEIVYWLLGAACGYMIADRLVERDYLHRLKKMKEVYEDSYKELMEEMKKLLDRR